MIHLVTYLNVSLRKFLSNNVFPCLSAPIRRRGVKTHHYFLALKMYVFSAYECTSGEKGVS
jgi:hypothetical protein